MVIARAKICSGAHDYEGPNSTAIVGTGPGGAPGTSAGTKAKAKAKVVAKALLCCTSEGTRTLGPRKSNKT